ncbi:hypothetical protein [Azospirillum aestuarii]|uniref:hypothetical protein n=1 Tax=Azospirillum aestuarii TaxID=2802052 RepID=UPI004054E68F
MSDALSSLYPSSQPSPVAPSSEVAAQLYPSTIEAPPAAPPPQAPAPQAQGTGSPPAQFESAAAQLYSSASKPQPAASPPENQAANALYGDLPQGDGVRYDEPIPDQAETILVDLPEDIASTATAEEMALVKAGLHAAGIGHTLARSLVNQAVEALRSPVTITPEQAEATLRQKFGASADAKIAAAQQVVADAAKKWPQVYDFLEQTGLINSPKLIEQLAARAARRAQRVP